MNKALVYLIVAIVVLSILGSAAPTLIALSDALIPLIAVLGVVVVIVRLVFFHTRH